MPTRRRALLAGLVAAACAAAGCSGSSSSPSSPSTTVQAATTETFNGAVPVGGIDTHPFTVKYTGGQLTATLTAAGPPAGIVMGLGIGSWSDPVCTAITGATTVTSAGATAQLVGTANAGSYCVAVYDVGNQTGDVTYTVTVSHY